MFTLRLPDTDEYVVGDKIELECEVSNETMNVRWFQSGREITTSKRGSTSANGMRLKYQCF